MTDRLPPHNKEAERSVLGSMLRDNGIIGDVVQIVSAQDFYLDAHRKLFAAAVELYDAGRPVDAVTVADVLHQRKQVEDIGGYVYLAELLDAAPTAANAVHYAGLVREKAILRDLVHVGTEIARDAYDGTMPAADLLEQAERKVLDIAQVGAAGQTVTAAQAVGAAFDAIDARTNRDRAAADAGVPSGLQDLDDLCGGLQPSELVVAAARPSVGKTALALSVARHVAVQLGLPVFVASLEQSHAELGERLLCAEAQVDSHALRTGTIDDNARARLSEAAAIVRKAPLYIDDSPGQSMLHIAANARRLRRKHGIRLLMIDYLQLVETDQQRGRFNRQEQVAAISRRLKALAKELKIPVIALAQLNRSSEDRPDRRPRLSDLRDSGSIEQDADTVLLLHKTDTPAGQETSIVEIIVAKQRNGPTGQVKLAYRRKHMAFEDWAP